MPQQPLHVVFCYAPQDEDLCQALEAHLSLLVRQEYITSYSSRKVGLGADVRAEIDRQMDRADLILLLVSADFLASDHLYDLELRSALRRRASHPNEVLGVLLRPCDWKHGELALLEMLPRDPRSGEALALTSWPSIDEGLRRVAETIRARAQQRVGSLSLNPPSAHPPRAPLG
ncbi:MAG: toll/interleukin-1 receptor domain-containing protein [Minicystis sp.]